MEDEEIRVRVPQHNETLGIVQSMLGANRMKVFCQDDKIRICRIPGKMRKRRWIKEGDVVLVKPWEIQSDKNGDIVHVYTPTQALWLRKKGILKLEI